MWHWSADTLFWQLSIDHITDVYYQVKIYMLQAPTLATKVDISHWFPRGADEWMDAQSHDYQKFLRWIDYQIFIGMGLARAWSSTIKTHIWVVLCCQYGISVLIPQTLFRGETSGCFMKSWLFFQANNGLIHGQSTVQKIHNPKFILEIKLIVQEIPF